MFFGGSSLHRHEFNLTYIEHSSFSHPIDTVLIYAATYLFFQYMSQCPSSVDTSALADDENVVKREKSSQKNDQFRHVRVLLEKKR